MEWVEILKPVLSSPVGAFVLGVLVLVFGSTAILSEKTAKEKFGAVGLMAKWWLDRKERAADAEESLAHRQASELWSEIKRVDELRARDKLVFEAQIRKLEQTERFQHKYIVWVTDAFRRVEVWAASKGYTLPPPPFLTFIEWLEKEKNGESALDSGSDLGEE